MKSPFKVACSMKFDKELIEFKDVYIEEMLVKNKKACNKQRLLSRRLYIIPETTNVRIGETDTDFIRNLVTFIVEHKCRTWKEERRRRRRLTKR